MPKTKVPKVDLLDINREPTDADLEALLQDMMDTVREKNRVAREAITPEVYDMIVARAEKRAKRMMGASYMADVFAAIKEGAKTGVARAREYRPEWGGYDQEEDSEPS